MIIPYKNFRSGATLPFVRVGLVGQNKVDVDAFVDSGADFSIFHFGWVKKLGLREFAFKKKKVQVGDGDYILVYMCDLSVEFYNHRFIAPITFSEHLGPDFSLLGRKGFFDRFKFCFDDKHAQLSVTKI